MEIVKVIVSKRQNLTQVLTDEGCQEAAIKNPEKSRICW